MSDVLGSYLGLPCHHWDEELPLIRALLEAERPMLVVETGTMYGGFAAFLADVVRAWGGTVLTVDVVLYPGVGEAVNERSNLNMVVGSVGDEWVRRALCERLSAYLGTLLYCDGPAGRPELELLGYSASVVGVHDYSTELTLERAARWAGEAFEPLGWAPFEALQAAKGGYFVSRFWRRRRQ